MSDLYEQAADLCSAMACARTMGAHVSLVLSSMWPQKVSDMAWDVRFYAGSVCPLGEGYLLADIWAEAECLLRTGEWRR